MASFVEHQNLTGAGVNDHDTIDAHLASTANPHSVTINQVKATTTKGDIHVEDGTNMIRLPVGVDKQVLTADSSTSTGLAWKPTESAASNTFLSVDNVGNVALADTPSWTDIPIPNNLDNSVSITISGTNIEFTATKAGKYSINVDFSANITNNKNQGVTVAMRLTYKESGGSYSPLVGGERLIYLRGNGSGASITCNYLLTMAIGDSIKIQAQKIGDPQVESYTGGTILKLQRLI